MKYNKTFQGKAIAGLITDKTFLKKIHPILDPTLFELEALQVLVSWIKEYFEKYNDIPDKEYFNIKINEINEKNKSLKFSVQEWYDKIHDDLIPANGLDYVKDEIFDFFNKQNWKKTLLNCVDLAGSDQFDEVHTQIKKAYTITNQTDVGVDYKSSVESRYNEDARVTIKTGYPDLDEILRGGFGNGDLVTVMAPSGIGKSWLLCNFGANILKSGKNIIHYTFEMTESQTAKRYDSILTKTPLPFLEKDPGIITKFIENNQNMGDSKVVFFPMNSVTVPKLKAHIETIRLDDFEPHAIIVDYGDLIKSTSKYTDKRLRVEEIFDQLKQMAQELDIPVITASQTNRSGNQKSIVQNDDVSEGFGKIMVSDIVVTFSRKLEDKVIDTGYLHIPKNRHGVDGVTFNVKTNLNIGEILIQGQDKNAVSNFINQQKAAQNGDFLRNKFSEFKSKKDNIFHQKNVSELG